MNIAMKRSTLVSMALHVCIPLMLVTVGVSADQNGFDDITTPDTIGYVPDIVGYTPASSMWDQSRIDLDQEAIQDILADIQTSTASAGEMYSVHQIYELGGFSKSYAALNLEDALATSIARGSVMAMACHIGGLPDERVHTEGCLDESNVIQVEGSSPVNLSYSYNFDLNNRNSRTLASFSTDAKTLMYDCPQCPYNTYQKFYDYYGEFDYANQFIMTALDQGTTTFRMGNADLSGYDLAGRAEFLMKGTVILNLWMRVIRQLEFALDICVSGVIGHNADAILAWDEAVAYYAGSTETGYIDSTDDDHVNNDKEGNLLYALANNNCNAFQTCGESGNMPHGTAFVNFKIMQAFQDGQYSLNNGQCSDVKQSKDVIVNLMKVPLIQGTLRHAHLRSEGSVSYDPKREVSQIHAAGAVFAASVLPLVYYCNTGDAAALYEAMRADQTSVNFVTVKKALEANYHCMGVTCSSVGSLWQGYFAGGAACSDAGPPVGAIVGGIIGGLVAAILLAWCVCKCRGHRRAGKDKSFDEAGSINDSILTPPYSDAVPPPAAFKVDGGTML
ncbi:hypothetical protein MHU86_1953 [Fragilaria crotonensis]|nr:hypothetical protein MHU86_1953 [Fragilaria crotonensis]